MKNVLFSLLFTYVMLLFPGNGMALVSHKYNTNECFLQDIKQVPEWVTRGADCFGIVFFTFPDGTTLGQSIKTKVLLVDEGQVRLRAMESVNLAAREGCGALGVNYGDTWWETEPGDLFETREKADQFLKEKGWLK